MEKSLMLIGLLASIIGTFLTGLIAQQGIPEKGKIIKAPNKTLFCIGWILVLVGFILQFASVVFDK